MQQDNQNPTIPLDKVNITIREVMKLFCDNKLSPIDATACCAVLMANIAGNISALQAENLGNLNSLQDETIINSMSQTAISIVRDKKSISLSVN